jgi:hypothetical protein
VARGADLVVVLIVNVTLIIYTAHMTLASGRAAGCTTATGVW